MLDFARIATSRIRLLINEFDSLFLAPLSKCPLLCRLFEIKLRLRQILRLQEVFVTGIGTTLSEDVSDECGVIMKKPLLCLGLVFITAYAAIGSADDLESFDQLVPAMPSQIVLSDGSKTVPNGLAVVREWEGDLCRSRLVNDCGQAVSVREVVLFDVPHSLPAATRFYGEGFTMLSQTGGTLARLVDLGAYTDRRHYRLPEPDGARTVYGMITLSPPDSARYLLGFTSCRRFIGRFHIRLNRIEVVVDTEGKTIGPGETWELEEVMVGCGPHRAALLDALAARICHHHPPIFTRSVATGWCSWYCFGPGVTADNVVDNLGVIAGKIPQLRYIQIDDGYQPQMGDWLDTGPSFGGKVQDVLEKISAAGFEPAIWVAPFVAGEKSRLFREHPDWFVKDDAGNPLRSDRVTFGGWRLGPWYVLDGTHPEACAHLEHVFKTMRTEWGCTYFKLDATFWGAIHQGRFHDTQATRIEAYRRGMRAIRRGAGNGFILGCNHPIWPSFGLIHGSRSSMDINRRWASIASTGRENLMRNWQNGALWWNDPDCVLLTGNVPENEVLFHAAVMSATGGMILSGDDLTKIPSRRLKWLRRLVPPTGIPVRFLDESLQVGWRGGSERTELLLFNWRDAPTDLTVPLGFLPSGCRYQIRLAPTGEDLGIHEDSFVFRALPGRSARKLIAEPSERRSP